MSDLISRQAAIDAVSKYNFDFPQYMERFVTELRDAMKADLKHDIEALPSAQPEIIHCGECKHRDPEDHKCDCGHDIIWQLPRDDKWYCADAERKDGEAEEPKKCDTCQHEKEPWSMQCHRCENYNLWEGKQ